MFWPLPPFFLSGWGYIVGRAPGMPVVWVALKGKLQLTLMWRNEPPRSRQVNHASFPSPASGPAPCLSQNFCNLLLLQILESCLFLFKPAEPPPAEGGVFFHQMRNTLFFRVQIRGDTPLIIMATPLIFLIVLYFSSSLIF